MGVWNTLIKLDSLTTEERAKLMVSAGERMMYVKKPYGLINQARNSQRQLTVWPFILADWLIQQSWSGGIPELDIVFAEMIAGEKLEIGKISLSRKRFSELDFRPVIEYPMMYDTMIRWRDFEFSEIAAKK